MGRDEGTLSVFVYDPLDYPVDWLTDRQVRVTLGTALYATGRNRPKWPSADFVTAALGHNALLGASGAIISADVMRSLPDLRFISKLGIGYEVIDVPAATALGIMVTNTPVRSEVDLVAEHAIALILALAKQLHHYGAAYIASGGWKSPELMSRNLRGSTVGILGLGHIGRAVAQRLGPWRARLIAYDIRPVEAPPGVELVSLEVLLAESDIVTLHAPGRQTGEGPLLDARRLRMLRPGALLVNTARGNLVDQPAAVALLREGHLGGLAADVFNPEPPSPDDPLLGAPNVLLTPHSAAWSATLRQEMVEMAMHNLWTMFNGGVPSSIVNPEVLQRAPR